MITTDKKIRIYDDTGSDTYEVSKVLYENDKIITCHVINEWHPEGFYAMIYKESKTVHSLQLSFYYAENY